MQAAASRRRILIVSAALLAGAALFFILRDPSAPDKKSAPSPVAAVPQKKAVPSTTSETPFTPPLQLADAAAMGTADIALQLAAWPEGKIHPDLPKWAVLLAERGPEAVNDLSSALATAGSNTARGVLADALARIGTDSAVQELCTRAVEAPRAESQQAIAAAFRALGRPAAVPMLATVFSQTQSPYLVAEASGAIRRLADQAGVFALADLAQEGGQLHSQRDTIFGLLANLQNPDALPALEAIAADNTDPARAEAARRGLAALRNR